MAVKSVFLLTLCLFLTGNLEGKKFGRCELANRLVKNGIPYRYVPTWVCIAYHQSRLDSSFLGPIYNGHREYGIFQISSRYWCAPPGPHNDCGMSCEALIDDNIDDDIRCAKKIYARHGFDAWNAWKAHCKGRDLSGFINDSNC
ncbi:lysozyme c-1-like [Centruroides vittatus]|uniref:lysozyme c-1-like n=1 Tax=Centruroides vittatus TaxID=120091 RepID=UPI00351011A4